MKSLLIEHVCSEVNSNTQHSEEDVEVVMSPKRSPHQQPYRRHSSEDEGLEIKFLEDPEIDFDVVKTVSVSRGRKVRSSVRDFDHTYDDSGFNSSDDDKDDAINSYCDSLHSTVMNKDTTYQTESTNLSTLCAKSDQNCDSEGAINSFNTPVEKRTAPSNFELEPLTSGQLVITTPGSVHLPPRFRHNRRRRFTDSNNNDTVNRLHSYLKPPPFKMNGCFQDRGLVCLMFCIAYTLFLFVLFGCLGIFMDLIKSALNKDDIEELRTRFSNNRQRRTNVTSG